MTTLHRVITLDHRVDDWQWPFVHERRAEIDAHFAMLRVAKPALWNGRVLLAREPRFAGETFSARYFETDFASFIAWRDWGFPDTAVINSFGMGALRGNDGGFVLGEMAGDTANAGRVYFPSGTPDLNDIDNGRVDIASSVAREVEEETGLTPSDYTTDGVWHCIALGPIIAMIRILDIAAPADDLRQSITNNLATQVKPELSAVHIVRGLPDITSAMPFFVAAFIAAQANDTT